MNLNLNYYDILGVEKTSDSKQIKKSYYKLSFKYHPDKNKDQDGTKFNLITEAYDVLMNEISRQEYDRKSKWGNNYNELEEFFKVEIDFNYKEAENNFERVKNKEVLDIIINIDETKFNGTVEFARWVICPTCKGSGKDMSTKISIKNDKGEIKYFEADGGCDFCDGSGKSWTGEKCGYCAGKGKVGTNPCKKCNFEGRIMGKQKLKDLKLQGSETKILSMGHWKGGRVGNLILKNVHNE